jgi:hypothetical protein
VDTEAACFGQTTDFFRHASTIAKVKSIFRGGLQAFERQESRLLVRGRALPPSLLARLPAIIGAFHDQALVVLDAAAGVGHGACVPSCF